MICSAARYLPLLRLAFQSSVSNAHRSWSRHFPHIFKYRREYPSNEKPARLTSAIEAMFSG
jgi:hypothetical protein